MVVKDIFSFSTMTDGYRKIDFMEYFKKIYIFCETFQKVESKKPYVMENSMKLAFSQPPVTVAKGKISFATVTHGFKRYFSL